MDILERPYRSVLYIPASNGRAIEKARTLPVDAIILDLEDAVAPDQKAAAREALVAVLEARA
ncbi:MAG: CoA ester lyase, partial [Alphaproteobacteria bacterium]